jgi:hypothetical protein
MSRPARALDRPNLGAQRDHRADPTEQVLTLIIVHALDEEHSMLVQADDQPLLGA